MPAIMDPALRKDIIESTVQASPTGILAQLDAMISSKLNDFAAKQMETNEAQITKIEAIANKDSFKFKNKGNEEQFKHSEKVLEKFNQADSELAVNTVITAHITEARAKIREGMEIVQHRQKLIKLADSSKHRWKVVEQYEAHQLAENSDDEKTHL